MTNSADPYQLASSQLIWIYTVWKDMVYSGSAGQGLSYEYIYDKIDHKTQASISENHYKPRHEEM